MNEAKKLHAMPFMYPYIDLLERTAESFMSEAEPMIITEIGTAYGYSTRAFLRGLKRRKSKGILHSIDINDMSWIVPPELRENFKFIKADSTKLDWKRPIDILLIDGDHSYEGAKKDYLKYEQFVSNGGLIFIHDVTNLNYGVKDLWKEISYNKIILPFNYTGIGIVQKL